MVVRALRRGLATGTHEGRQTLIPDSTLTTLAADSVTALQRQKGSDMTGTAERMPTIYVSHGAPLLADDPIWPAQLAAWSGELPKPKAILMISAHWEDAPLAIGATTTVPLI